MDPSFIGSVQVWFDRKPLALLDQGCRNVYGHTNWSGQSIGKIIVEMQLGMTDSFVTY